MGVRARTNGLIAIALVMIGVTAMIIVVLVNSGVMLGRQLASMQIGESLASERSDDATPPDNQLRTSQRSDSQSAARRARQRVTLPTPIPTTVPEVQLLACGLDDAGWPAATVQVTSRRRGRVHFVVRVRFIDDVGSEFSDGFALLADVGNGETATDVASAIDPAPTGTRRPVCEMDSIDEL